MRPRSSWPASHFSFAVTWHVLYIFMQLQMVGKYSLLTPPSHAGGPWMDLSFSVPQFTQVYWVTFLKASFNLRARGPLESFGMEGQLCSAFSERLVRA